MSKWITALSAFVIALTFTASSALACSTASGEVAKIDATRAMLVMNSGSASGGCESTGGCSQKEMTFVLKKDTKILVNGKAAKLADLRAGDKVKVDYERSDDVLAVNVTRST